MSSRSLRPNRRKLGVATLAATLGLAGLGLAGAPMAAADTVDTVTDDCGRLAGQTRYGTAGAIGDAYEAESPTDTAILANGLNFPDALAASALGRELNAPVLLTDPNSVPLETTSALEDLGIANIVIVGGTAAVSQSVEDSLEADYAVTREAGDDRYETAAEIALAIGEAGELNGLTTALIATGNNYPDALAGGPVAYHGDGTNPFPILLTNGDEVPAATEAALEALGIEQVIILGGTSAVPASVEAELVAQTGNPAIRLAGENREGTAADVADFAVEELGFAPEAVLLADGYLRFPSPDALSGGPLGGVEMAPILLVNDGDSQMMPAVTEAFIEANEAEIAQVIALGGTAAVATETLEAGCEAGGVPIPGQGNQTFAVTPQEAATNVVSTSTSNTGAREYSVAGLAAGTYDIRLFPSANVIDTDGVITFVDADNNDVADPGTVAARIEQVNGLGVVPAAAVEAQPGSDGTLTFLVDATQPDSIIPVIFLDAEATGSDDDALDLDADNAPTEDFGIGGLKVFTPAEAADTNPLGTDTVIQSVDKVNNAFVLGTGASARVYFYEAEDTFQIAATATSGDEASTCAAVDQATFEAALSSFDEMDRSTVYFNEGDAETTNDGPSTFCIEDLNPDLTQNVTASRASDTTVVVTIADDDTQQDTFNVYRAAAGTGGTCPDFQTAGATGRGLYALVGTVDEDGNMTTPEESFTDTGLTANTTYCYAVTAVNDGDEGPGTNEQATTTLTAGDTIEPVSQDVTATNDEGAGAFGDEGTASTGDVWRVIFDEAIDAPNAGDTIRVVDADGEFADITCTTDATCTINASAVTIGTQTYAAGRVLTITLTGVAGANVAVDGDTDGNAANNDGVLEYELTITRATGFTDADADNAQWTPLDDPDNVINVNETAPATTAIAPTVEGDDLDATADTLITNWTEPVTIVTVAGFDVFSDASCSTAVGEGAGADLDAAGDVVEVDLGAFDFVATTTYYYTIAADTVEDADGVGNVAVACTPITAA
jgi:putative cell wall-binding protein